MYGINKEWAFESNTRTFDIDDYKGAKPRWCPGCGDHAVLTAVQRLFVDRQLPPEDIAVISGIGCSSRFPHYLKTYGFHGLHGRALPVAEGVRSRRPDLHIFVITGDGDSTAIGTGHWVHSLRYNMKMTILFLDNNIYGLTKMQTSPTTPLGHYSNTHPGGAPLSPLNPLSVALSITNASFIAQTVDWNMPHLSATLRAAYRHDGTAFVRIRQRCPHYVPKMLDDLRKDPTRLLVLNHEKGIPVNKDINKQLKNHLEHDPHDLAGAHKLALRKDVVPIGLLYKNEQAERYDVTSAKGLGMSVYEKMEAFNMELDRFTV